MFLEEEPYKKMINDLSKERKIIYLTYGGSHAYGTNVETSDIDLRGIALKTKGELLGTKNFEQFLNQETDTTIYAVDKFIQLASNCNPNIIEMLGTKEDHKFLISYEMKLLLDNKSAFISQLAINSFSGYATAQLRRFENAVNKNMDEKRQQEHILNTLNNMQVHLQTHYNSYQDSKFKIYVDKSDRKDTEYELFVDINMKHYPLLDFNCIQSEMVSAIKAYSKLNHRNNKTDIKIDKHLMHLIRLYLMLLDILELGEINTYRVNDIDILMDIRNGYYSLNNYEPLYELLGSLEKRVTYAKQNTDIPKKPNYKLIEEVLIEINERSIK